MNKEDLDNEIINYFNSIGNMPKEVEQHIKNVKRLLSRKYVYVRMTKAKSMPVIVETQNMSAFLSSAK